MIRDAEKYRGAALDVVVLAGQSNAQGCGIGEVADAYEPDERILMMQDTFPVRFEKDAEGKDHLCVQRPTEFVIGLAREAENDGGQKLGNLALAFARRYVQEGRLAEGRRLLIVNGTYGGTGFARNEWGVTGCLYLRLCDMLDELFALGVPRRVEAFLWHQGECDSFENASLTPEERYRKHLSDLTMQMENFRGKYGKVPFVCGGFTDEWTQANGPQCGAILRAMQEYCQNAGRAAFVGTQGLASNDKATGNGDSLHFCRASLYVLGEKYYNAYLSLLKN